MDIPSIAPSAASPLHIAVVGDIHDQWDEQDAQALQQLGIDLVLFVGDFGNESVAIAKAIAGLDLPKAIAFGNHDAWYTATPWGRQKCPYKRPEQDWLQQQLDLLGAVDVGYDHQDFDAWQLGVVGGRPFSWGGPKWRYADFYAHWYGVHDLEESTQRITAAAMASRSDTLIFLGHNGPAGLGDQPEDPCGRDWPPVGGDFGDPDLTRAIATTKALPKRVPLVTFGHMHHNLRHTKTVQRTRLCVDVDGTVYLNAACVPRLRDSVHGTLRNFSLVTLDQGTVQTAQLAWVDANGKIIQSETLYDVTLR